MLSASPSASSSAQHDVQDATYAQLANGISNDSAYVAAPSTSASSASQPRQFSSMSHQIHPPNQQATPPSPSTFATQHTNSSNAGAMTSSGSASAYLTASSPQRGTASPSSDNGSPATHGSSPTQIKFDPGMNMQGMGGYRGMPERSDSMASFTNHDASMDMSASPASTPGGPAMAAAMSMPPPPMRVPSGSGMSSSATTAAEDALRPSTKFVHKLYRMVSDTEYQHLISWNATGTSVVVTNFDEFAKEVLGKHFKHSNFSSFIRQLNMYGFYKVNKTPRGHRNAVDTQVWEFSHPKFLRGRADLLDEIRRKALDSEHARVEARDLQYSVSVGQMQLRAQVEDVQFRLDECMEVNVGLRGALVGMREVLGGVLDWIKATNGGQLPYELRMLQADIPIPSPMASVWPESPWGPPPPGHDGPPIFVTEPQFGGQQQQQQGQHPQDHPHPQHHPHHPHHHQQQQHGEDYNTFAMGNMGLVSPVGSRRVSAGSAQSEMMLNAAHSGQHSNQGQQSPMLHAEAGRPMSASRSSSFSEHQAMNGGGHFGGPGPGFSHGRPIAGKPGLTGLNIDTSAMSSHAAMMQAHQQQQHLGPGSAGGPLGSPGNPGLGVMTPMGGPGGHMMVAINTPLPPSPAVATSNSGGFMLDPTTGAPYDGTPNAFTPHGFAQHSYAGGAGPYSAAASSSGAADPFVGAGPSTDEEMLRPNAKALRTPLKRTASNSKERTQAAANQAASPQGMPAPPSPGLMKRKSPV